MSNHLPLSNWPGKFRADRFLTLYFFYPVLKIIGFNRIGDRIPILMYHSISERAETVHPYFQTHTSPAVFEMHMRYLKENDYQVIGLEEAVKLLESGAKNNHKKVVITFDDGFLDFYTHAAPILERNNFRATVFLPAGFIAESGSAFKGIDCLNWAQVKELLQRDFSFGSHTMTHPQLFSLKPAEIDHEIRCSKERIETKAGQAVTSFSYPYAFPDGRADFAHLVGNMLQACGYKVGVTTRLGSTTKADTPFFLKRTPVNSQDDVAFFKAKLLGAYNWLYWFQAGHKKMNMRLKHPFSKAGLNLTRK